MPLLTSMTTTRSLGRRRAWFVLSLGVVSLALIACDPAPSSAPAPAPTTTTTTMRSTTTTTKPKTTTTTMPMGSSTSTTMPMGSTSTTMPMGGSSGGMSMGADQCALPQLAFCDTFQTKVGGGREGDLDPAKWSFSRTTENNNPSQGLVDNYAPSLAQFCMTSKKVQPDGDSFICGQEFGESNHWMESMDDNGFYVTNSNRIRQPFDFAGRTGNMVFDVDAKTEGSHSFWNEVWLTDQPTQSPHTNHPGLQNFPRNGVAFIFDGCGPLPDYQTQNGLGAIVVFNNYVPTTYPFAEGPASVGPCFTTQQDHANHFQIKVSSKHLEVWASDAGGTNFRLLHALDLPSPLNLTRGYWNFQHIQYNAAKFNSTNTMTYHWHAIGFDGPVLPMDGGYEIPDALKARPDGTLNLGYQIPTAGFSMRNVNLTGVTAAYLTYNVWWFATPPSMTVTVNGQAITAPGRQDGTNGYLWTGMVVPIPLNLLHAGTNTVSFQGGCADQCPTISNIDLETVH